MSIEAMKQWLKALENTLGFTGSRQIDSATRQAITSLRQAIAEAEKQEPVARVIGVHGGMFVVEPLNRAMVLSTNMALYTAPPQQNWKKLPPEEPPLVKWAKEHSSQPKREWVGLTEEEVEDLLHMFFTGNEQIKAIEAKLKEKNT